MSTTQAARKKFTIAKAQVNLYPINLASVICDTDTEKMGTIYNPYTTTGLVTDGTVSSATYNVGAYATDADEIQVNRRAQWSEHVDSFDQKSMDMDTMAQRGKEAGKSISQVIDGFILNLPVVTAGVDTLDDGDFGGTPGNPKTSSNSVIDEIINLGIQETEIDNAFDKKFMVVSSYEANDLRGYLQSTGNMVMDEVIRAGIPSSITKAGTTFSGVDVFQSNNITQVAALGLATQPTAGDTISIAGVTLTFVAALTGAAAEIHIASTVDITRANLVEWLNAAGASSEVEGADAGYSAASTKDKATLSRLGIVAVNNNSTNVATVTTKGVVRVAEVLTDGTDTWATPYRFLIFGEYNSINLYLPTRGMDYEEKAVSGKPGRELYMEQFYNGTIWSKKKDRVKAIKVN